MADAEQPDVVRFWTEHTQLVACISQFSSEPPAAASDVDGDVLAVVVDLDLRADVALVDLVAEAGDLVIGSASHDRMLSVVRLDVPIVLRRVDGVAS